MDAMLLVKASVVLSAGLGVALLLRGSCAAVRHRYWTLVFVAVLALPILVTAVPALHLPMPLRFAAPVSVSEPPPQSDALTIGEVTLTPTIPAQAVHTEILAEATATPTDIWNANALLPVVWLSGTIAALAALLLSLLRVSFLSRSADDLIDSSWRQATDLIAAKLGLHRHVRLLVSDRVGTPMAGGLWRPAVFLPTSAIEWSAERRDIVLAHELAHLAGRDSLRHLLVRLGVALYWFHPLAWLAARRAAIAREEACDQTVLAMGTRPSTYARVLLDLADSIQRSAPLVGALPIIEPSLLEMRLMAILKDTRPAARQLTLIPALILTVLTLAVAAAQPLVGDLGPRAAAASTPATEPANQAASVSPNPIVGDFVGAAIWGAQTNADRNSACAWDARGSFDGSISMSDVGGRSVIYEQVGTRGNNFVVQKNFGDLRLCMIAEGVDPGDRTRSPSQWSGLARRVVMEARRGSTVQQLESEDRGKRTTWRVGATDRPLDDAARQWRERMLAVLDTTWELSMLRGTVSSLRGAISSIRGHQSSLRGEISSLRGHVSSMRGRISSLRGEESSLRGEISSIRGHVSSLRGAISSARGAISSLNADRYRRDDPRVNSLVAEHEAQIARLEKEIVAYNADTKVAAVEREIQELRTERSVAEIDAEIRAFDLDGKVAAIERQIAALDVEGKIGAVERQIQALDADRRGQELEARREAELKRLDAAMAAVR